MAVVARSPSRDEVAREARPPPVVRRVGTRTVVSLRGEQNTNTAIDLGTTVPCTGVPAGGGRNCAWRMYYVDIVNSLNAYGASIITG